MEKNEKSLDDRLAEERFARLPQDYKDAATDPAKAAEMLRERLRRAREARGDDPVQMERILFVRNVELGIKCLEHLVRDQRSLYGAELRDSDGALVVELPDLQDVMREHAARTRDVIGTLRSTLNLLLGCQAAYPPFDSSD